MRSDIHAIRSNKAGLLSSEVKKMPNTKWSDLSSMQVGRYGEYYAKMEFTSYGFDVYTSEVDDHGVDFVAKDKNGTFYEVQVKSVRNDSYMFIKKSKLVLDEKHLICFIRFVDGQLPDCYVFPSTVFESPDGGLFSSKDYEGLKSQPEYGINVKSHLEEMQKYRVDDVLKRMMKESNGIL